MCVREREREITLIFPAQNNDDNDQPSRLMFSLFSYSFPRTIQIPLTAKPIFIGKREKEKQPETNGKVQQKKSNIRRRRQ